jgi:hypothetical protein
VKAHPAVWILRVLLLVLALVAAPVVGAALSTHSRPVQLTGTTLAWVLWASAFAAAVIPDPISLTVLRMTTPTLVAGLLGATLRTTAEVNHLWQVAALALALVTAIVSCSAHIADACLDARSYGAERRYSLRTPGVLLAGPVPLSWATVAATVVCAPLLFAAKAWLWGVVLLVVGGVASAVALRSVHALTRRFAVLVPAGVTLVDPFVLIDAVLIKRTSIDRLGAAFVGTTALDLSQGAPGLSLELQSREPIELTIRTGRRDAEQQSAAAVVFNPARPGAFLAEAATRSIAIA